MQIKRMIITVITSFSFAMLNAQREPGELVVGDSAPPLTVVKWLKGEPLNYEKDKMYAVEFSGTWCPPCRKAIPHLTAIQKKYGDKIPIISVFIMENNKEDTVDVSYVNKVSRLMEAMGPKMDYTIAVDVPRQTTKKDWKLDGAPEAFVIQAGKIIWIGNPMEMEPVFEKLTNGNFDTKAALIQQNDFISHIHRIKSLKKQGNYQLALLGIDSLIKIHPEMASLLYYMKFGLLAGDDDVKAYKWVQWLLDNKPEGFDWPHFIGDFRKISPGNRNFAVELKAIDFTISESETRFHAASSLSYKAATYALMGDFQKAVEACKLAIEFSKEPVGDSATTKTYEADLVAYQYRLKAQTDKKKASDWIRSKIGSKDFHIDFKLINTMLESKQPDHDLALALIDEVLRHRDSENWNNYWAKYFADPLLQLIVLKADAWSGKGNFEKALYYYQLCLNLGAEVNYRYYSNICEKKIKELKGKTAMN